MKRPNTLFVGTKLLDRLQKIAYSRYGTVYEDIGLVDQFFDKNYEPYFILYDNEMDKICTVTRAEIKHYMQVGKIK